MKVERVVTTPPPETFVITLSKEEAQILFLLANYPNSVSSAVVPKPPGNRTVIYDFLNKLLGEMRLLGLDYY